MSDCGLWPSHLFVVPLHPLPAFDIPSGVDSTDGFAIAFHPTVVGAAQQKGLRLGASGLDRPWFTDSEKRHTTFAKTPAAELEMYRSYRVGSELDVYTSACANGVDPPIEHLTTALRFLRQQQPQLSKETCTFIAGIEVEHKINVLLATYYPRQPLVAYTVDVVLDPAFHRRQLFLIQRISELLPNTDVFPEDIVTPLVASLRDLISSVTYMVEWYVRTFSIDTVDSSVTAKQCMGHSLYYAEHLRRTFWVEGRLSSVVYVMQKSPYIPSWVYHIMQAIDISNSLSYQCKPVAVAA